MLFSIKIGKKGSYNVEQSLELLLIGTWLKLPLAIGLNLLSIKQKFQVSHLPAHSVISTFCHFVLCTYKKFSFINHKNISNKKIMDIYHTNIVSIFFRQLCTFCIQWCNFSFYERLADRHKINHSIDHIFINNLQKPNQIWAKITGNTGKHFNFCKSHKPW